MTVAPSELLTVLEQLAPLEFAEAWDNVGLLLEPLSFADGVPIAHVLLTIDLSEDVVDEAEACGASLIVAYHPPIFQGLKRLRVSQPSERVVLRCASRGIGIFSPHTALDAAPHGVNDWLLDAFEAGERGPCLPDARDARYGQGRFIRLERALSLTQALSNIKRHLGLSRLRVATAGGHAGDGAAIRSIAVCAGAGGSVFEKLGGYDLYLTGEMRHHDVRARVSSGSSVVLCEHTHTERGFLPVLAARLTELTAGRAQFHVSRCDRDPLVLT